MICTVCSKEYKVYPYKEKTSKYCSFKCKQIGCGRKGGKITGDKMKEKSQGKTYTKISGRHSHRVIMERFLGRLLIKGEIVHHKDGNILNNNIENLELLSCQGDHVRSHHKFMMQRRKEIHGH